MQVENESGGTGIIRLIDKCLDLFEMTVSALALLGMTVSVLLAIVLRYVLKVPNIAGEEISRYLLVTMVFIGISMCVRTRSLMGVTIFVDMLPACLRRVVMVIADIITTVTLGFISVLSWLYVASSLARPQFSVTTGMPMAVIYTVMALGLTLSALRSAMLFWSDYLTTTHPLGVQKGGDDQ